MNRDAIKTGNLLVVGMGLIGGSLALGLRRSGFAETITAWNRSPQTRQLLLDMGLVDYLPESLELAVASADMIVIGVPTLTVASVFEVIREHAKPGVVMTDVASVKGSVIEAARSVFGSVPEDFVPGHPIAGAEKSGPEASQMDLFKGHRVILTPLAHTRTEALRLVTHMWQDCAAEVVELDHQTHDRVLAMTSHLPHVLAYSLVDFLVQQDDRAALFRFAAGGFRDSTRIASSDVTMWRDICLANRQPLLDAIDMYNDRLQALRSAISDSNGDAIASVFQRARDARAEYLKMIELDMAETDRADGN